MVSTYHVGKLSATLYSFLCWMEIYIALSLFLVLLEQLDAVQPTTTNQEGYYWYITQIFSINVINSLAIPPNLAVFHLKTLCYSYFQQKKQARHSNNNLNSTFNSLLLLSTIAWDQRWTKSKILNQTRNPNLTNAIPNPTPTPNKSKIITRIRLRILKVKNFHICF